VIRRLFWMSLGAGLGLFGRHKAKKTVERYVPPVVAKSVGATVKSAASMAFRAQLKALRQIEKRNQKKARP
jgi:hypothetical protein